MFFLVGLIFFECFFTAPVAFPSLHIMKISAGRGATRISCAVLKSVSVAEELPSHYQPPWPSDVFRDTQKTWCWRDAYLNAGDMLLRMRQTDDIQKRRQACLAATDEDSELKKSRQKTRRVTSFLSFATAHAPHAYFEPNTNWLFEYNCYIRI